MLSQMRGRLRDDVVKYVRFCTVYGASLTV